MTFGEKLKEARKKAGLSQEQLAEKMSVSRSAVAKWEAGDSIPDLDKCKTLAEMFGVSLDDLANYESDSNLGLEVPPKGKHLFGLVTVGDKGQIVIPAKARKVFDISSGDQLVVLGDEAQGMAIMKAEDFMNMANLIKKSLK